MKEIKNKINEYLDYRSATHPRLPSAGCVFTNLTLTQVKKINPQLAKLADNLNVIKGEKIAVGWLIDQLNLKGKRIGEVKVSLEHANHIVNTGKGQASEVVKLINYLKKRIKDQYKIILEEEIELFGFK